MRKRTKELLNYAVMIVGLLWFSCVIIPEMLGLSNISLSTALLFPFLVTASVLVLAFSAACVIVIIERIKRKHRARKRDARIIAQAKASGAWYEIPTPLGGRALELYAWHNFKIKRNPGETDASLRRCCDLNSFAFLMAGKALKEGQKHGSSCYINEKEAEAEKVLKALENRGGAE